ncbi:MAG: glutamine-hydrolyzing carbamoyl-phosphate synthase small subunit [Myxococcota bacterium]
MSQAPEDSPRKGWIVLADGARFSGTVFGKKDIIAAGEAVFTTAMTGYQEVLSDPSYTGQIVAMTAPQIGNTGVNAEDTEGRTLGPHVAGFVVRDASSLVSNWRADDTLDAHLARHGVVALADVDTRSLTKHIRDHGAQNAALGADEPEALLRTARSAPAMTGLDLVARVTPAAPYRWTEGSGVWRAAGTPGVPRDDGPGSDNRAEVTAKGRDPRHVVVLDLGIKRNILRCLVDFGCHVTAVPATTSADEILALSPDGIFLSNGPGDPSAVTYAIDTVAALLGKKPMFGICLGHQLLALAAGARTYKLKFGHRGINHPVKNLTTGRVEVTSQNHGFCVDLESLPERVHPTHVHLNDGTNAGLALNDLEAFGVQFHPEAAGGPHDALYLFERFVARIDHARRRA